MTTKAALKARIADDIVRSDLTTQIGEAIDDAIEHYKSEKFYFTETRSATFATVASQSTYTSSDDADIPLFFQKAGMLVAVSATDAREVRWIPHDEMEYLIGNDPASGVPTVYSFFADSFFLNPTPDGAYTIRPFGGIEVAGPASDGETGNVWMTEAFELIRCRAKGYIYAHIIGDMAKAQVMSAMEESALSQLRAKTSRKVASGRIVPTKF